MNFSRTLEQFEKESAQYTIEKEHCTYVRQMLMHTHSYGSASEKNYISNQLVSLFH